MRGPTFSGARSRDRGNARNEAEFVHDHPFARPFWIESHACVNVADRGKAEVSSGPRAILKPNITGARMRMSFGLTSIMEF
jgi:hypothetical protein